MPIVYAASGKTPQQWQEEYDQLRQVAEDAASAYQILRRALEGAMGSRDLVLRDGSQASILKVYELMEAALIEAEVIVTPLTKDDPAEANGVFCDRCQRWLSPDEQAEGRCLTCQQLV